MSPSNVKRSLLCMSASIILMGACAASGPRFPWPARGASTSPGGRADVVTVNASYARTTSPVLVRKISRPTRAALDYAAYCANFMNADPAPEGAIAGKGTKAPDTKHPFDGKMAVDSLTGALASTPLTRDERLHPIALPPLTELLVSKHVAGADRLEDVVAQVRAESWGLAGGPQIVRQTAALGYLHDPGEGRSIELWIKIEFAPWFTDFSNMPDDDGDGFPNVYGRVDGAAIGDLSGVVTYIRSEYEGRVLSSSEVKGWAHQLASYWYPSYNTDLVADLKTWPANDTEADVVKALDGLTFAAPTVVMRGKPQGKPVYNLFLVDDASVSAGAGKSEASAAAESAALKLPRSKPSPEPDAVAQAVKAELSEHGGSWPAWSAEVAPLHEALKARVAAMPAGAKALSGSDGFLFFRQSIAYVLGGDLGKQKRDRNPIPVIAQFAKVLAKNGVDFLFVPVPTKVEIYPEKAAAGGKTSPARFAGKIANPFERKFLLDLASAGIETVDLLPTFLSESATKGKSGELLYQAQDTHWSSRGLQIAAKVIAERVRRYPWYKGVAAHRRTYHTQDATFTRHGDLHSRLPETEKGAYAPETLVGKQVMDASGTVYDDDADSPLVLLGDSFTGVFQLMDCEHAGVSAHLAKELGYPMDLVMSYGGGPNVRQKLMRRGESALSTKKLVIWMMTARDLYDFWEGWQPLGKEK